MFNKNLQNLLLINITLLISFMGSIELLLGKWIQNFVLNKDYIQIPAFKRNVKFKYDGRWLYSSKDPVPISYIRDKFGYRSKDANSNKKIFLTMYSTY